MSGDPREVTLIARRGRPTRGGTVRRLRVNMTDEEHAALKQAAKDQKTSVAELVRRIAPVDAT